MTNDYRPIPGFPGYAISACGQVLGPGRSNEGKGVIKQRQTPSGPIVTLSLRGSPTSKSVAKLVREVWP